MHFQVRHGCFKLFTVFISIHLIYYICIFTLQLFKSIFIKLILLLLPVVIVAVVPVLPLFVLVAVHICLIRVNTRVAFTGKQETEAG